LVRRVDELGWRMAEAAGVAGISQRQGYRWLARYRSGGAAALGDRSSAPGCCPHRIGAERITEITGLRRQRLSGPAIARQLGMSVSTVGAILWQLASHNSYHTGQIATIRRCLNAWPPKAGGDTW